MKGLSEVKEKQLLMIDGNNESDTDSEKKKCSNKILVVTLSYVSSLSYTH